MAASRPESPLTPSSSRELHFAVLDEDRQRINNNEGGVDSSGTANEPPQQQPPQLMLQSSPHIHSRHPQSALPQQQLQQQQQLQEDQPQPQQPQRGTTAQQLIRHDRGEVAGADTSKMAGPVTSAAAAAAAAAADASTSSPSDRPVGRLPENDGEYGIGGGGDSGGGDSRGGGSGGNGVGGSGFGGGDLPPGSGAGGRGPKEKLGRDGVAGGRGTTSRDFRTTYDQLDTPGRITYDAVSRLLAEMLTSASAGTAGGCCGVRPAGLEGAGDAAVAADSEGGGGGGNGVRTASGEAESESGCLRWRMDSLGAELAWELKPGKRLSDNAGKAAPSGGAPSSVAAPPPSPQPTDSPAALAPAPAAAAPSNGPGGLAPMEIDGGAGSRTPPAANVDLSREPSLGHYVGATGEWELPAAPLPPPPPPSVGIRAAGNPNAGGSGGESDGGLELPFEPAPPTVQPYQQAAPSLQRPPDAGGLLTPFGLQKVAEGGCDAAASREATTAPEHSSSSGNAPSTTKVAGAAAPPLPAVPAVHPSAGGPNLGLQAHSPPSATRQDRPTANAAAAATPLPGLPRPTPPGATAAGDGGRGTENISAAPRNATGIMSRTLGLGGQWVSELEEDIPHGTGEGAAVAAAPPAVAAQYPRTAVASVRHPGGTTITLELPGDNDRTNARTNPDTAKPAAILQNVGASSGVEIHGGTWSEGGNRVQGGNAAFAPFPPQLQPTARPKLGMGVPYNIGVGLGPGAAFPSAPSPPGVVGSEGTGLPATPPPSPSSTLELSRTVAAAQPWSPNEALRQPPLSAAPPLLPSAVMAATLTPAEVAVVQQAAAIMQQGMDPTVVGLPPQAASVVVQAAAVDRQALLGAALGGGVSGTFTPTAPSPVRLPAAPPPSPVSETDFSKTVVSQLKSSQAADVASGNGAIGGFGASSRAVSSGGAGDGGNLADTNRTAALSGPDGGSATATVPVSVPMDTS